MVQITIQKGKTQNEKRKCNLSRRAINKKSLKIKKQSQNTIIAETQQLREIKQGSKAAICRCSSK